MNLIISYYLLLFVARKYGGKVTCKFKIQLVKAINISYKYNNTKLVWESTSVKAPKLST